MTSPKVCSPKPYLVRAVIEWCNQNKLTPHILVHADIAGVDVPQKFVQEGRIIFDVAEDAVRHLKITDHWVSFQAEFGGVPCNVTFPVQAIGGVFSKENCQGAYFNPEEDEPPEEPLFEVIK